MFTNFDGFDGTKKNIKADVIILGCTLPGIVAAYKLKASLGDTMQIVVLDLALPAKSMSRCENIGFQDRVSVDHLPVGSQTQQGPSTQQFIVSYSKELNIPFLNTAVLAEESQDTLVKVFQDNNGNTIQYYKNFHDFEYLGFLERFELSQYHNRLEQNMQDLFQSKLNDFFEQSKLRSYDQTSMEKHLRSHLLFSASREIMALTVRLVCGAPASEVSLLFYLHQCYRNSSVHHLDGNNLKFREKILGYCRKRLAKKLQQSIADITLKTKSIAEIRTNSNEQVILETLNKETSYVCKLLAMALPPDALETIRVESELLSTNEFDAVHNMQLTRALKFVVHYENNFWRPQGFSGEIFSIKGPILWAMEKPKFTNSGFPRTPTSLVGFLELNYTEENSKTAVLQQLVSLFGSEAASPLSYRETDLRDIFIPKCGDYVTLIKMSSNTQKLLVWGALDIYADGDLNGALEAGHRAYLSVLQWFRPQAIDYDDAQLVERPLLLVRDPVTRFVNGTTLVTGLYILAASSATVACFAFIKYLRKQ